MRDATGEGLEDPILRTPLAGDRVVVVGLSVPVNLKKMRKTQTKEIVANRAAMGTRERPVTRRAILWRAFDQTTTNNHDRMDEMPH